MDRKIELLAPGGDVDSIKAAIAAGADAIYCGLDRFNARSRAENIGIEDLNGILRLAHSHNCQVFITLNIIIVESELPAIIRLLNRLSNTAIDGVIVQDIGLFYILTRYFKGLRIHASTQLNTHNEGQIKFLSRLNASRVNLARELNMDEIKALAGAAHKKGISIELFVHGSYCISFSGLCYMSSVNDGNSGNRGRCSQPCRDQYGKTPEGKEFPLNLKDNSAWFDLEEIAESGVDSIKIEGRIKGFDYVYAVTNAWRNQLDTFYDQGRLLDDNGDLYRVFNRDFSDGYLKGDISREMFIDNPRDFSIRLLSEAGGQPDEKKIAYYEGKKELSTAARNRISQLTIEKAPLTLSISGELGSPLKITVRTPDTAFDLLSESSLVEAGGKGSSSGLNYESLLERFKAVNATEYRIDRLDLEDLKPGLFLPFKELTSLKKRVLFILNGSRETVDPIKLPLLKKRDKADSRPTLSLLISSQNDLSLLGETEAEIFFQPPNNIKNQLPEFIDLFLENKRLLPWFPSVLIGEDYDAAVELLRQVQPERIVTNNTGIAYEASERGIDWIAGPYLNSVNSYSLLCLQDDFNCSGAFISNELRRDQIGRISAPEGFSLYYSIYHPIVLMTSRQCFFHRVTGCEKERIDKECIQTCNKRASITNLKGVTFTIQKREGSYNAIYNNHNFLNREIVTDLPGMFDSFFIDLRDIETAMRTEMDKKVIVRLFEDLLGGMPGAEEELKKSIHLSTNDQYKKGI